MHMCICVCPHIFTDTEGNWDFDLVTSGALTTSATSIDHDRYNINCSTDSVDYSIV